MDDVHRSAWLLLHTLPYSTEQMPPQHRGVYRQFVLSLILLYPCRTCREKSKELLTTGGWLRSLEEVEAKGGGAGEIALWASRFHGEVTRHAHPERGEDAGRGWDADRLRKRYAPQNKCLLNSG